MQNIFVIALGLIFLTSSISFLILNRKQRDIVLERLGVHSRRASASLTPPRSLSPEKQGLPPNSSPCVPEYQDVFPPSRRYALADLPPDAFSGPGKSAKELSEQPPDYSKLVPDKSVANADALKDHVTATGFTVEEIRRLGDFPDYAALSGVPLPTPYPDFDITKAKFRPYRPLRWAYHQTMCMWAARFEKIGMRATDVVHSTHEAGARLVARTRLHLC